MALTIRVAGPDEAVAIAALVNAAFVVEAFFKRGDRTNPDEILGLMGTGQFLLSGPEDGPPVACVFTRLDPPSAYFGMLSVSPSAQGRGIGRALVSAIEARARDAGCDTMEIHVVNLREELPPYYRRLGYEETGQLPFPDDEATKQPCHFIVMRKRLDAPNPQRPDGIPGSL